MSSHHRESTESSIDMHRNDHTNATVNEDDFIQMQMIILNRASEDKYCYTNETDIEYDVIATVQVSNDIYKWGLTHTIFQLHEVKLAFRLISQVHLDNALERLILINKIKKVVVTQRLTTYEVKWNTPKPLRCAKKKNYSKTNIAVSILPEKNRKVFAKRKNSESKVYVSSLEVLRNEQIVCIKESYELFPREVSVALLWQ
jgi:hypothetical protein